MTVSTAGIVPRIHDFGLEAIRPAEPEAARSSAAWSPLSDEFRATTVREFVPALSLRRFRRNLHCLFVPIQGSSAFTIGLDRHGNGHLRA